MLQRKLALFVLAFLLFAGSLFYWWKSNSNIAPTEVQPSVAIPVVPTPQSQHIEAVQGSDEVWYSIPELSIKMRMHKDYANDLIYEYRQLDGQISSHTGVVYLATKQGVTDGSRGIFSSQQYFAAISRNDGLAVNNDIVTGKIDTMELKQFNGYYVFFEKTNGKCVLDSSVPESITQKNICYIFQSIQPL